MYADAWTSEFSSEMLPATKNAHDLREFASFEEMKLSYGKERNREVDVKGFRTNTGMVAFLIVALILITGWNAAEVKDVETPPSRQTAATQSQMQYPAMAQQAGAASMCAFPESQPLTAGDALPALSAGLGHANQLVFQVSPDAQYWLASNCGGSTVFLEDAQMSMENQPQSVQMSTRFMFSDVADATPEILDDNNLLTSLAMSRLPEDVKNQDAKWDQILVESGGASNLNIFAARRLAGSSTTVFVDDCQQTERSAFMRRWFAEDGVDVSIYSNGRGGMMCKAGPGIPEFGSRLTKPGDASTMEASQSVFMLLGMIAVYACLMCKLRMSAMDKAAPKR